MNQIKRLSQREFLLSGQPTNGAERMRERRLRKAESLRRRKVGGKREKESSYDSVCVCVCVCVCDEVHSVIMRKLMGKNSFLLA